MPDLDAALARWKEISDLLVWSRPPDQTFVAATAGHGTWFPGGELDLVTNVVDRHAAGSPDRVALHWEGEPGDRRALTYGQLRAEVEAVTAALHSLGIGRGDRVALHLGLLPEAVIMMLACARLGAVHAVLPAVLPVEALAARLRDLSPQLLVTQDGAWRHGVVLPLKARADEALAAVSSVQHTVVVRRAGIDVPWYEGDRWWHELLASPRPGAQAVRSAPAAAVPADHPCLVAYIANRRGAPTGLVLGTAGLLVVGLAGYAFISNPSAVSLDGKTKSPGEVDAVLHDKARIIKGRLDSAESIDLAPSERMTEWFEEARRASVGADSLAATPPVRPTVIRVGGEAALTTGVTDLYAEVDPVLHPLAERSVRAHLDKLAAEGAVTVERRAGQETFRV